VPGASPVMVVLMPVPVVVVPPGVLVKVQVPVAGKLFNTTLPDGTAQVGCVLVPTVGADGEPGTALITISDDEDEVHPAELVTVKVYVPGASPVMVVLVPDPLVIVPPGVLVKVHVPLPGKLFNPALPVGTAHVGCVIFPALGADGEPGIALITIFADEDDVHPEALVTV
jgi:hypothetical protein